MKKLKDVDIGIIIIAVLFTIAALVSLFISVIYSNGTDYINYEVQTVTDPCRSTVFPEEVKYNRCDVYTTPYGTYRLIDSVLEMNEYMVLHPTVLDRKQSVIYICEDEKNCESVMRTVDELSDRICAGLQSDYEKVRAIAMWVGTNVAYDECAARTNGSELSVVSLEAIIKNDYRTTCGGFSNLFSALCHRQGICSLNMRGGSASEGWKRSELDKAPANHEWNAVLIDGKWYGVDCTWISDLAYNGSETTGGEVIKEFYAVFGFGEMTVEHRADRCELRCYGIRERNVVNYSEETDNS